MLKTIKTLELKRWSEPDEQQQVKRIGMANAQEIFNKLEAHLKENNLLPDEYFLFEESNFTKNNGELPEVYNVICNTNFGGSEGIYLDIILKSQNGNINFATGKTLDDSVEAFYKMSRIGAECSLMLNSYGNEFKYDDKKTQLQEYKLNKEENTVYIILEKNKDCALLKRFISENSTDPAPYIIANGINFKENNLLEWDSGKYYSDISSAVIDYSEEIVIFKEPLIGEIDFLSPDGKTAYTEKYVDIDIFKKDIKECLNDGEPIEVRDFSKQNIYSNAVADMCGYDEAQEQWEQEQEAKAIAEQEKMFAEKENNINEHSDGIVIDGYCGANLTDTWYVIDTKDYDGETMFLLESEQDGDEVPCLVVNAKKEVLCDEAWNGFLDYEEMTDEMEM